tara:strand:+ start:456 stop:1880 length:1425 start_codon:yes stop_codon:yes gene_type:complete
MEQNTQPTENTQQPKSSKVSMKEILAINKLKYALPSRLSVVERRQNKISYADATVYSSSSGNEVVVRLTASQDYTYGPNSYLTFDIEGVAADGDLGFKSHTAMALFREVIFEDRSGVELERVSRLNSYCAQVVPWHHGSKYKETVKAMAGQFEGGEQVYSVTTGIPISPRVWKTNGIVADYDIKASKLTVSIPLRHFLGIFDRETLIPSMLLSGSMIRLQLETPSVALQKLDATNGSAVVATDYTLRNVRVVLDSMALKPVVQKNLLEQSQSGGLDYTYETAYHQSANPGTGKAFNLQVNKAVARVQKIYWSARSQTTPAQTNKDSLGTSLADIAVLQYRVGDLYLPTKAIRCSTTDTQKNGAEFYENSLQSVKRMKTYMYPTSITKDEFLRSGLELKAAAADNDNSGRCVHVQSFEMSSSGEYSGLGINNSRTLEVQIEFQADAPALSPRTLDSWIKFVKLAKCSSLRTIIKE